MPKPKAPPRRPMPAQEKIKVVKMPRASIGACKNALRKGSMCANFEAELANGLCLTCWDRSLEKVPLSAEK